MKLAEMSVKSAGKINKLLESRFGFAINYSNLTVEKAEKLSETISANLNKIRHSVNLHTAERNPRYMELLTVKEGLTAWLDERRQQLVEGEVGNAEVLLAAKDMVDSVQDAIEKVGKMQNEQLPQLLDSIRDQIGSEQAEAFKNAVGTTLDTLMQNLQSAREGVDNGVRVLSGEQVDNPMALPGDAAPDLNGVADLPPAPGSDLDQDETDGFGATDAAVGGAEELGRELR
jgi:plasmid stabilization system protein ParE